MSTIAKRVALLARPGVACDRLRGALVDAGADLVLEANPLTLDPATLDAAQAQVVLVALDAQTEEALDRFEAALHNPAVEVIFEEAELAARREGWEAARWGRHLAAKLHRHDDVLPPGSDAATATAANDGDDRPLPSEAELERQWALEGDPGDGFAIAELSSSDARAIGTTHEFDPLFGELTLAVDSTPLESDQGVDLPATDPSAEFDPSLNFDYDGEFDVLATDIPALVSTDADTLSGFESFVGDDGDELALDAVSLDEPNGGSATDSSDPGFDAMFTGDFGSKTFADPALDASAVPRDDVAVGGDAVEPVARGKRVLELVDGDQVHHPDAASGADGPEADHRFRHDLASLESRIAGMELVDDRIASGPAQANGAVLVIAGIGGPDAVRQLLAALPEDFPRPVLVQQRLDGGRYDKLVAQMQRATAMLVKLAEPGLRAIGGVIYILPAGIGIKVSDTGVQFADGGDDILAALPSADSAVLLLSGSDPAQVDAVMSHSWAGALVMGQSPDGCYDAQAPNALLARGGGSGQPAELAERLSARWRS